MTYYVNSYRVTLEMEDGKEFEWEGYAEDQDHAEGLAIASATSKKVGEQVNRIIEVEEFDQFEVISDYEATIQYDELLDCDGAVMAGGLEFYPSRILEELDPTAYRCGFSDFVDSLLDNHVLVEGFY